MVLKIGSHLFFNVNRWTDTADKREQKLQTNWMHQIEYYNLALFNYIVICAYCI